MRKACLWVRANALAKHLWEINWPLFSLQVVSLLALCAEHWRPVFQAQCRVNGTSRKTGILFWGMVRSLREDFHHLALFNWNLFQAKSQRNKVQSVSVMMFCVVMQDFRPDHPLQLRTAAGPTTFYLKADVCGFLKGSRMSWFWRRNQPKSLRQ